MVSTDAAESLGSEKSLWVSSKREGKKLQKSHLGSAVCGLCIVCPSEGVDTLEVNDLMIPLQRCDWMYGGLSVFHRETHFLLDGKQRDNELADRLPLYRQWKHHFHPHLMKQRWSLRGVVCLQQKHTEVCVGHSNGRTNPHYNEWWWKCTYAEDENHRAWIWLVCAFFLASEKCAAVPLCLPFAGETVPRSVKNRCTQFYVT